MKLALTKEEKHALDKAFRWMEEDGEEWMKMDEGYVEACTLANLLKRFSEAILDVSKKREPAI
jgi:hypothetical protein